MAGVRFLSVADVLAIQDKTIRTEGGTGGLRDVALLESAVATPRQRFGGSLLHADLAAMAAAYLYHLSGNHPFLDGNKRVAVIAALVFLEENGVPLSAEPAALEQVVMRVASGQLSKGDLAAWLRRELRAGPSA